MRIIKSVLSLLLALSQDIQGHELAASQAKLREKEAEEALDVGLQELKQASSSRLETHDTVMLYLLFPPRKPLLMEKLRSCEP